MDKNQKLLYLSLLSFIVIGVLHHLGIILYLYWIYWWFDLVVHFLSGLAGGLIAYWMLFHSGLFFRSSIGLMPSVVLVLIVVMITGVAWEIFEYIYNLRIPHENYSVDVAIDLIMDGAGAILAGIVGLRTSKSIHG